MRNCLVPAAGVLVVVLLAAPIVLQKATVHAACGFGFELLAQQSRRSLPRRLLPALCMTLSFAAAQPLQQGGLRLLQEPAPAPEVGAAPAAAGSAAPPVAGKAPAPTPPKVAGNSPPPRPFELLLPPLPAFKLPAAISAPIAEAALPVTAPVSEAAALPPPLLAAPAGEVAAPAPEPMQPSALAPAEEAPGASVLTQTGPPRLPAGAPVPAVEAAPAVEAPPVVTPAAEPAASEVAPVPEVAAAPALEPAPLAEQPPAPTLEAASVPAAAADSAANSSIIRTSGFNFVDDNCRVFYYTGWNLYNELTLAATFLSAPPPLVRAPAFLAAQNDITTRRFAEAQQNKLRVVRMFAVGGDNSGFVLQPNPGQYNETVFRALDYVLAQAALYQLKLFRNHLAVLANRRNTYTGVLYKNDPAIFSWNLFNEVRNPDCQCSPEVDFIQRGFFVSGVHASGKIPAACQLTFGEQGFFVTGSPYEQYNPNGVPSNVSPGWPGRVGQNFAAQHSSPNIDYDPDLVSSFVQGRQLAGAALGKPVVLEEFGKVASSVRRGNMTYFVQSADTTRNISLTRDPFFRAAYDEVEASIAAGKPLQAALFWEWLFPGRLRSDRAVKSGDSTFQLVQAHAQRLRQLPLRVVPGCLPRSSTPSGLAQARVADAAGGGA